MKKLIFVIALAVPTLGQTQDLLDLKSLINATRVGAFADQHKNTYRGVYATIFSINDSSGLDLVDFNGGWLERSHDGKDSPLAEIGFRLDNVLFKARSGEWGQRHTKLSPLPTIEFGPFASGWLEKVNGDTEIAFLYGLGLAVGF